MTKTRRSILKFAGAAAGAAMMVGFGATVSAAEEPVTLKLHQFLPAQANVPKYILSKWASDVEAASNGSLKIEQYPAMQLGGKPNELMDQAIDGVADIVWTVVGYTPGRFPRTEVFELPFMMTNAEAVSRAYWEMFDKDMKDKEFKDVHIIGTWVHGPGLLHTNKPVKEPSELAGMKIRGGSRAVNMLLEEFGATPVGMPVPAVSEALSKGVIDGTTVPWEVTPSVKVSELVHNHTEFSGKALYTITFVLAMNKAKYESLSPEAKAAIDANSGMEFSAWAGMKMQEYDAPARQIAVDLGNNIISLSPEETQKWVDASAPVYDKWAAEMDAAGYDGKALISEAQDLIAKYTK